MFGRELFSHAKARHAADAFGALARIRPTLFHAIAAQPAHAHSPWAPARRPRGWSAIGWQGEWRGQDARSSVRAARLARNLQCSAAELRCFYLDGWAAARIGERSAALCAAQRAQANAGAWMEMLHATAIGLAAASALALSVNAGAPRAALAALAAAITVDAPPVPTCARCSIGDD